MQQAGRQRQFIARGFGGGAERDALVAPAAGTLVFNTTSGALDVWDGTCWWSPTRVLAPPAADTDTFCPGDGTTLHLPASWVGDLEWQSSPDGEVWTTVEDESGMSLDTGELAVTRVYRGVWRHGASCTPTAPAAVRVRPGPTAGTASLSSSSGTCGYTTQLTLAAA